MCVAWGVFVFPLPAVSKLSLKQPCDGEGGSFETFLFMLRRKKLFSYMFFIFFFSCLPSDVHLMEVGPLQYWR